MGMTDQGNIANSVSIDDVSKGRQRLFYTAGTLKTNVCFTHADKTCSLTRHFGTCFLAYSLYFLMFVHYLLERDMRFEIETILLTIFHNIINNIL